MKTNDKITITSKVGKKYEYYRANITITTEIYNKLKVLKIMLKKTFSEIIGAALDSDGVVKKLEGEE